MRPIDAERCEMKRLFVRPPYLGKGYGRALAREIIHCAKQAGYDRMVLDTLEKLEAARALYARLGFQPRPPYNRNPLPGVVYLELDLGAELPGQGPL